MWKWPEGTIFDGNWRGVPDPVTGEVIWHEARYPDQWDSETRDYWGVTWEEPPTPVEEPQGLNYSIPKAVWLARLTPEEQRRIWALAGENSHVAYIVTQMTVAWTEVDVDDPQTAAMIDMLGQLGVFQDHMGRDITDERKPDLLRPMD